MVAKADNIPNMHSIGEQVLCRSQSAREIIQDFVPLAQSLEWELGQQYFRERGSKAFTADSMPVPYVINNDGTLSRNAAEVLFTSLVEAEKSNSLEEYIFVLELGIGVGLFARFFLDHFKEICARHKKNYYQRLCYVAGDRSVRMLIDVLRHGVLSEHAGHFCVRPIDALEPAEVLRDVMFWRGEEAVAKGPHPQPLSQGERGEGAAPLNVGQPPHPRPLSPGGERGEMPPPPRPSPARGEGEGPKFRAVFLNYLLDCLPAAALEIDGDQVKQLEVRTCVARNVTLADYTDLSITQLQHRAQSKDPKARQELLEVFGLFASEYDYRPVEVKKIPYGEFAVEFGRRVSKKLLVNFGAMQCLERLLDMIHDDGFVLMNEYGHARLERDNDFEHQRFSYATAVGLNFPLLQAYFGDAGRCEWLEPGGDDERGIHTRLASKRPSHETKVRFQQLFMKDAFDRLEEPIKKARGCVQYGRFELAADYYQQALKLQPRNWVLMNEISMFLTYQMRDAKSAIDMAKLALALNPTCSADLWSTLGDALYEAGRFSESRGAYEQAMAVNENDVRSRYSLAWVFDREKNYAAALTQIADALALDKMGRYRDRLLAKQQEVLHHLALRNQQEYLLLINLVSKHSKKEETNHRVTESTEPELGLGRLEPRINTE